MAKLTLQDVTNLQNESTVVTALTNNNDLTEIAMENTLSRDGLAPNQMLSNLDMNNYKVINLPNATTAQEPATYSQLQNTTAAITAGVVLNAPYVTVGNDPTLFSERALTGSPTISITDTGPQNQIIVNTTRTLQAPAAGFTITNPAGTAGDPTFVLANDLAAYEGLASNGLVARTATDTATTRSITQPAAGITVTNGDGVSGNPTLALVNDLSALEGLATTGIARRTGTDTWTASNAVTNAELNTMGAFTFKGNNTSGTATPTDVDIHALTSKATPAATDEIILSDQAASGAWKKATVSSLNSASVVTNIAGNTGAFTLNNTSGITNSTNDIILNQATSSQFGAVKVDNVTILANSGIIGQKATTFTNALGADVALNNTANFFDGPSVAQGTSGTWFVSGSVTVDDTAGQGNINCKLWDGTTVLAAGNYFGSVTAGVGTVSLSGVITSPAGNLRISCKDITSTSGKILFNQTGTSKDSMITAIRIQ